MPEAGQGALAMQVRAGEEHLVAASDHDETRTRVEMERACVAVMGGGCLAPVAAYHDGERLTGLVAAEDGIDILGQPIPQLADISKLTTVGMGFDQHPKNPAWARNLHATFIEILEKVATK